MLGLSIAACYDVDRLRAGRDLLVDAGREGGDGGITDGPPLEDAPQVDGGGVCPAVLPPPTDGLVAFYPLDETSGPSVSDCSGRELDGVVIAASAQWTPARNGGGLRLSTAAGCAQLGTAPTAGALDFTGPFSVTVWINVVTFPGPTAGYIVGKTRDPDIGGWRLATGNNAVDGTVALPTGVRLPVSAAVPSGRWVHLGLVVVPGGTMTLYIDGTPRPPVSGVPNPLIPDRAATARLGCRSDGTQSFDGVVDDVRIFSRALTAAEIATIAK